MSRGLDGANVAASDAQYARPVTFVSLDYDSGMICLHDDVGPLSWGSQTWEGVGDFGGISQVEEGDDISPYGVTLTLSGLDTGIVNEAMAGETVFREVSIYVGFRDTSGALVADPQLLWRGEFDGQSLALGETNAIAVQCESHLARFEDNANRRYTDADLQAEFSGDLFFEYLDQMLDARFVWGGETREFNAGTDHGFEGEGGIYH